MRTTCGVLDFFVGDPLSLKNTQGKALTDNNALVGLVVEMDKDIKL